MVVVTELLHDIYQEINMERHEIFFNLMATNLAAFAEQGDLVSIFLTLNACQTMAGAASARAREVQHVDTWHRAG